MKKLRIQYISKIFLVILGITPLAALAHVKWFAEETQYVRPYHIADIPVIIGIIAVILVVCLGICLGIYLEKKITVPTRFDNFITLLAPRALSIASIGFGLAFIIFSINGFIFAPNLPAHGSVGTLMLIIQGVAGIIILLGFYERFGGVLLLILFGLGMHQHGSLEMLDTLEMIGFALYLMIVGRPLWKITETEMFGSLAHSLHSFGYPLLRIGVGFNLIILGFTEKILVPSLTQNFLTTHTWNFMSGLGMSDYWFSFAAGISEILFGVFFVLGLVTRITTLALAVFLIITLYLLGPVELIGHLPHFSIAIVLLVLGSGSRFVLIKNTTKAAS